MKRNLTVVAETSDDLHLHMSACAIQDPETGLEADLTTTIGLGGLHLLLRVEKNGKVVREKMDLRPMIEAWVAQAEQDM